MPRQVYNIVAPPLRAWAIGVGCIVGVWPWCRRHAVAWHLYAPIWQCGRLYRTTYIRVFCAVVGEATFLTYMHMYTDFIASFRRYCVNGVTCITQSFHSHRCTVIVFGASYPLNVYVQFGSKLKYRHDCITFNQRQWQMSQPRVFSAYGNDGDDAPHIATEGCPIVRWCSNVTGCQVSYKKSVDRN